MSHPRLAFEPLARRALLSGFNTLANALRVALGPRGRLVAVAGENPRKPPELLNDGALIARRFLGLPSRFETMGAFLARHIAWRMEEAVGDGATTAVVIAQKIMNETARYLAAGHNVMELRRGMEKGATALHDALGALAHPLDSPAQIEALATVITGNPELGRYIEEIFDTVGPHGAIQVRTNYGRTHDRRYIRGAFWNQGWASSAFNTEPGKAVLKQPYILFTNIHLETGAPLAPILRQVHEAGKGERGLVVMSPVILQDAINLLAANKTRDILPTLAIKAPGLGSEKDEILQDLAALCGGRMIFKQGAERLEDVTLDDLGQADEVQAIRSGCTIIGGKGRPAMIRKRVQELREQIPQAAYGRERERLGERAGKLMGGVALLEIGGATDSERDYLKDRAKEAVHVVRLGMQDGVVPGGGVAYLRCLHALDALDLPPAEAAALPILRQAITAPMAAILANSGLDPAPIVATVQQSENGRGYDVLREMYVDMLENNIVDPLRVAQMALRTGVSGALMALTTEVLVHKPRSNRNEEVDFNP